MTKRIAIVFAALLSFVATYAQEPTVTDTPPAVEFGAWRTLQSTDFWTDYEMVIDSPFRSPYPENNRVRLNVKIPTDTFGSVPVVVILHYWGADNLRFETATAERLAVSGIASVIMPLPYHLSRTPAGSMTGAMAILPDPKSLTDTMTQSILDIKRVVDWIEARPEFDNSRIGLTGTSLGAIVASLAFAVEPRFATSAFLLGGVDVAHILWNSSRVVNQREALRRAGYTEEALREELASIEPLNYLDPTDARRTLVIAARHDTVVPARSTQLLIDNLGAPEHIWLDTGHFGGAIIEPRIQSTVASFLAAQLTGREFSPPSMIYAPTIRIGILTDPETGLSLALGLDLWKSDAFATGFGSVLVTPTGVKGYVGYNFSKNIAFGATIGPKRTTLGLLWSFIL